MEVLDIRLRLTQTTAWNWVLAGPRGLDLYNLISRIKTSVTTLFPPTPTVTELITDGVHQYSYQNSTGSTPSLCKYNTCEFSETLPFDLGSMFNISTSANAAIGGVRTSRISNPVKLILPFHCWRRMVKPPCRYLSRRSPLLEALLTWTTNMFVVHGEEICWQHQRSAARLDK